MSVLAWGVDGLFQYPIFLRTINRITPNFYFILQLHQTKALFLMQRFSFFSVRYLMREKITESLFASAFFFCFMCKVVHERCSIAVNVYVESQNYVITELACKIGMSHSLTQRNFVHSQMYISKQYYFYSLIYLRLL